MGVVVRRQVLLLGRFADFLAPAQRLVIEVDGACHGECGGADVRRDAALGRAGYRVVRVEAWPALSERFCRGMRDFVGALSSSCPIPSVPVWRRNDDVIAPCYLDTMSTASKAQARPRETLNIRIRAEERGLIDRAAAARGTNRTDFILDAARRAAEDALLDQSLISVGPKAYAEFIERLDAPAKPNARLRRTMKQPLPWKAG